MLSTHKHERKRGWFNNAKAMQSTAWSDVAWYPSKWVKDGPNKRGLALLLSYYEFSDPREHRFRTCWDLDEQRMKETLEQLGYEVFSGPQCHNLTYNATFDRLEEVLNNHFKPEYDSFVLYIASHGDNCLFYCSDGQEIELNQLIGILSVIPALLDLPKILLIQACQGKAQDEGLAVSQNYQEAALTEYETSISSSDSGGSMFQFPTGLSQSEPTPSTSREPEAPMEVDEVRSNNLSEFLLTGTEDEFGNPCNVSDFFVFLSTFPGHASYRTVKSPNIERAGSAFVRFLCSELNKAIANPNPSFHLLALATVVCNRIALDYSSTRVSRDSDGRVIAKKLFKQMPCFKSTLSKLFRLTPSSG